MITEQTNFAHECRIRDSFANQLCDFRENERLIGSEQWYQGSRVRVDMRTIDKYDVIREWEFKIFAGYEALGQILTYVSLARRNSNFERKIQGVIAAFDFQEEVRDAIEIMNLGIELVTIPPWLSQAGNIPNYWDDRIEPIDIPNFNKILVGGKQ
ncbi:hypothetical protein [Bacillus infantis]|uniref:hypothetical protein n=1 Tax=Bacillus infantis TaxID=324767 RepID=UPI003CF81CCC